MIFSFSGWFSMNRLKDLLARFMNTKFMKLVLRGIKIFGECNMSVFAGYGTLFIVTSLFPLIMLIISFVNLLPGYSAEDVTNIIFQLLPDLGPLEDLVGSIILNLKDQTGGLLASAAAVTTLWSASKGVSAVQKGLDALDQKDSVKMEKKEDNGLKEKANGIAKDIAKRLLFTLMLVIFIPALLIFEMLGDSIAGIICSALEKLQPEGMNETMSHVNSFFHITSLVVILLAILVILAIYALLPAKHRTLKSQLPGAILTCVCWLAFTKLFSLFIPQFFNASLYGSLASLFLMLLWLWCIVMILFAGGVLNHTLEEEPSGI